jgi:hypothetical protein
MAGQPELGGAPPLDPAQPKPAPSWEPPLYRRLGWLSGATFLLLGFSELGWAMKAGLWLFGLGLFVYWLIERVEERQGRQLMRLRMAFVPVWFGAQILLLVGGVAWLLG